MAQTRISRGGRLTPAAKTAAAWVIAASLAGWGAPSAAEGASGEDLSVAKLERLFWACDHAATQGRIDTGTAIACGGFTERLKLRKFNGDFAAMLAWWQANKAAEHLALDTAGRSAVVQTLPAGAR